MNVSGKGFSGRGNSKCKEAKAGHRLKFFKEEKQTNSLEGSEQRHGGAGEEVPGLAGVQ